jgi:hypothetical protein
MGRAGRHATRGIARDVDSSGALVVAAERGGAAEGG